MGSELTVGRVVLGDSRPVDGRVIADVMSPRRSPSLNDADLDRLADRLVEKMNLRSIVSRRMMDIPQTAAYLGRTIPAVQNMVKRGTIPSTKLDGKVQIDRVLLDRLIEAKTA